MNLCLGLAVEVVFGRRLGLLKVEEGLGREDVLS